MARFHVQAGAYQDQGAAQEVAQSLRHRGYAVTVLLNGPPYRVWVGGLLDQATAERLAATLQAAGFNVTLAIDLPGDADANP